MGVKSFKGWSRNYSGLFFFLKSVCVCHCVCASYTANLGYDSCVSSDHFTLLSLCSRTYVALHLVRLKCFIMVSAKAEAMRGWVQVELGLGVRVFIRGAFFRARSGVGVRA